MSDIEQQEPTTIAERVAAIKAQSASTGPQASDELVAAITEAEEAGDHRKAFDLRIGAFREAAFGKADK